MIKYKVTPAKLLSSTLEESEQATKEVTEEIEPAVNAIEAVVATHDEVEHESEKVWAVTDAERDNKETDLKLI